MKRVNQITFAAYFPNGFCVFPGGTPQTTTSIMMIHIIFPLLEQRWKLGVNPKSLGEVDVTDSQVGVAPEDWRLDRQIIECTTQSTSEPSWPVVVTCRSIATSVSVPSKFGTVPSTSHTQLPWQHWIWGSDEQGGRRADCGNL